MAQSVVKLHVVRDEPPPDLSYEWKDRQRIARKDWAALHVATDKRAPVFVAHRPKWKAWLR